jgi:3-hydroxyacyl-CoA dehydrogenase
MANEGVSTVEDGTALRASDVDVVLTCGYGFPKFRGGPIYAADKIGGKPILDELKRTEDVSGPGFVISKLLRDTVSTGNNLVSLHS